MKICNREDFMKLPPGTLYCRADSPWAFENSLYVKLKTICQANDEAPIDWFYRRIDVNPESSHEMFKAYDEMLEKGVSRDSVFYDSRDGLYEKENVFMVFEKEDLELLKDLVNNCIMVTEGEEWEDER